VAFGLVTLNPPFCRSSLKSRVEPLTNNALLGSTTIRTLAEWTKMSRGAGPSTKSILYCRPEQPPPITARRKAPSGRPCFSSRELSRRAAFAVTRINFSLPILIPVRSGLAVRAGPAVPWGLVSLTKLNSRCRAEVQHARCCRASCAGSSDPNWGLEAALHGCSLVCLRNILDLGDGRNVLELFAQRFRFRKIF
jgi:hypothetical protein